MKHPRLLAVCCTALALCLAPSAYAEAQLEISKGSELHRRLGAQIGASDLVRIDEALDSSEQALNERWKNPADGNIYVLAVAESFDTGAGPCRAFDLTATIQTRRTTVHGLACRKHGQWRIVE